MKASWLEQGSTVYDCYSFQSHLKARISFFAQHCNAKMKMEHEQLSECNSFQSPVKASIYFSPHFNATPKIKHSSTLPCKIKQLSGYHPFLSHVRAPIPLLHLIVTPRRKSSLTTTIVDASKDTNVALTIVQLRSIIAEQVTNNLI